jgi:2-polyprenyl-6-methoxyphenol hydroxylase-like FAD-dependent oxidoreductase
MSNRTVLISGAGIAGPTLAFWLKAAGLEPTLVERAPALRSGGYVIDFWGRGYDIAERMGLLRDINRVGYHMREMRIVNGRGERVAGFGTRVFDELTGGRFVTLARSDLSRLLFATVENGTKIMFGDEIVALQERWDGVQVQFKHAAECRFDLVIGADGLHSTVRRLTFGAQDRFERRLGYCVAAFEVRGYRPRDDNIYVMYGAPGRMLGRVALHDDRTLFLFVFAVNGKRVPQHMDVPAQKTLLRATFADGQWECGRVLAELDDTPDLYFDHVSQISMENWSKGRIALVGDAAFCPSLLAGQGSALAMTAAYILAGEFVAAGGRHEAAFAGYERLLRGFIESKQRAAAGFAGAFAPRTRFGLFFRNQVVRAFAIPGLARLALGREITDTLQLPDYRWPALAAPRSGADS